MKIEQPSQEALIRYYRGESLPREEKLVELYLAMDTDHEYVESCLREAWNNLDDESGQFLHEQEKKKAWKRFQQKKVHLRQFPARRSLRWYGYAACIVLFLLATVTVTRFNISKTDQVTFERFTALSGDRKEVKLTDSSTVVLFPGSSLDVPAGFNGKDRKVILKGRAFFQVAHNIHKPFLVEAGKITTKVLGTSFEVNALDGTNASTVTLRTGKVSVNYINKEIARLVPDQKITYNTGTNKFIIEKINAGKSVSWVNGELTYDLAPLAMICHDMEKWYNVKISIKNDDMRNKKITTSFKDLPVNKVLDMLSETTGFTYTIKGNQITIN